MRGVKPRRILEVIKNNEVKIRKEFGDEYFEDLLKREERDACEAPKERKSRRLIG